MRLMWEVLIAILSVLFSIYLGWLIFNSSAIPVAKGGSEALYGVHTMGISEFAKSLMAIIN